MKRIILMTILSLCIFLNGCCILAGAGMKSAKDKRKTSNDNFHRKVCERMDRMHYDD